MHVPAAAPLSPMTTASLAGPLVRYGFAAVIGAAISALLQRSIRRFAAELANDGPLIRPSDTSNPLNNPSATSDPLSRPYDCQLCKLRWRCPSDQQAHLASKEHRRNVALLKASQPHGGALSKEDENMHCAFCNVWLRDAAAYSIHVAGKRHARNVAAAAGTLSFDFFGRMRCGPPSSTAGDLEGDELDPAPAADEMLAPSESVTEVATSAPTSAPPDGCGVITCDLEKPENAGSICRLLSNFSYEGASLVHVHSGVMAGSEAKTSLLFRSMAMKRAARNSDSKLDRRLVPLAEFVSSIATWPRPIVAVETAPGAVDIHGFAFPKQCDVLVGGETRGIHPSILAALRPDLDAIIYIPMPGFARSMNVAAATCAALYEHRRQHPRPASQNGGRAHGEGCTKEITAECVVRTGGGLSRMSV